MKPTLIATLLMGSILPALAIAQAQPSLNVKNIPAENQTNLNVAIYNENRALINDTRSTALDLGNNKIAFADVSSQIIAQSALLQGTGIRLLEQNFNFDLLSEQSLLEKAIGQNVTVQYINPANGRVTTQEAHILSVNGPKPILKIGGKIETDYPGRILFNKIPENLWSKPTLVMHLQAEKAGPQSLQLSYLTNGLSWKADYVAQLTPDETHMHLNGLITLTNNSGTNYKNATVQLIAGDVNIVQEYVAPRFMHAKNMMVAESVTMDMAAGAETLSDFHLYTLPFKTDVLSNQTKQVALFDAADIQVSKTYEFNNSLDMTHAQEIKKVKPDVYITFENKKENNLGIALPKGVIRLYKADSADTMLFVGEDSIAHTANLENVRLKMGQAFDITADGKRIQYEKIGEKTYEATYEITLKNGSSKDVDTLVFQRIPGTWKILSETTEHIKENSNRVKWNINIPANGEYILTYKVQVKNG